MVRGVRQRFGMAEKVDENHMAATSGHDIRFCLMLDLVHIRRLMFFLLESCDDQVARARASWQERVEVVAQGPAAHLVFGLQVMFPIEALDHGLERQ